MRLWSSERRALRELFTTERDLVEPSVKLRLLGIETGALELLGSFERDEQLIRVLSRGGRDLRAARGWQDADRRSQIALVYLVAATVGLFLMVLVVVQRWTASSTSYIFVLMPAVAVTLGALVADERSPRRRSSAAGSYAPASTSAPHAGVTAESPPG